MQKVVGPSAVMVGEAGKTLTVTMVVVDTALWHPFALITLTV